MTHEQKIQALTDKIDELLDDKDCTDMTRRLEYGINALDIMIYLNRYRPLYALRTDGWLVVIKREPCDVCNAEYVAHNPNIRIDISKPLHGQSETTVDSLCKLFFE